MQSKIGCYIIAVAVITVWSTTFVSTKILLHSLSPEEIMFYRHVLAYLVLRIRTVIRPEDFVRNCCSRERGSLAVPFIS